MRGTGGTQRVAECHIEGALQHRVHDTWTQLQTQIDIGRKRTERKEIMRQNKRCSFVSHTKKKGTFSL